MDLGFEAAKGASEKVLGVRFPILMRVILPGLQATAVLYPSVAWILHYLPAEPERLWERIAACAVLVFPLGALISTTNSEIYKIYEGRIFWPPRLFEWARTRQQARVDRLVKAAKSAKAQGRNAQYNELWYQLRIYPVNGEGKPEATHPTRIGNILAGYEQYPNTRYGMDSVFYWPRIWMQIGKDQKEEIDGQWSVADGFLTLSAIAYAGGIVWMLQSLAAVFGFGMSLLPLGSPGLAALGGVAWLAPGFLWYRLSLPFHRENGEVFKSIFDIYRHKVWKLTSLKPREKEVWDATWSYLQYLQLKCPNCPAWPTAAADKCHNCGFGLLELKNTLRDTGRFPSE